MERDVRDLHLALERNIAAVEALAGDVEALAAEMRELRRWIESTSESTKDIAESRTWRLLTSLGGPFQFFNSGRPKRSPEVLSRGGLDAAYMRWIAEFETNEQNEPCDRNLDFQPAVSIVAVEPTAKTIDSIVGQSYRNWECCLARMAPNSAPPHDSRIRCADAVAAQTWECMLQFAVGDYVAVIEPDAVLQENALVRVIECLQQEPRPDLVYTDEDVLDESGRRNCVFFKPDWSPDLLLSMNYVGGLFFFRREMAIDAGASCAPLSLHSTYELLLELSVRAAKVLHVAHVLCHRSPARSAHGREHGRGAIDAHLQKHHLGAFTEADPVTGRWRVRYPPPPDGRVSIVIPSGGKGDLLELNLEDLDRRTDYGELEIIIVDNSTGERVKRMAQGHLHGARPLRYVDWRHKPFNFATICNVGAASCDTPFLLFLNDDVRVLDPGWLRAMVELAARPEVGVVGARLLFPDGTIQHAGVALGLFGSTGHVFKGLDGSQEHYFGLDRAIRNVSAVTGACMLVRREVFSEVGGFDENHYPVDFNDIDLCLRIHAAGYRVLYTPYAELCHDESFSRHFVHRLSSEAELGHFRAKWSQSIANDPFYNPNLTRAGTDYSPRRKGE